MKRKFLTAALVAAPLLWASAANALLITITGGESPTFPPVFQTLASGGSPLILPSTACCGATNSFLVSADATGTPPLASGSLDTNTIDVNSTAAGTLTLWVTEQGLTSPSGNVKFTSGLTSNAINGAISSVTLSTFFNPANTVAPPNGTALDSASFTGLGTQTLSTTDNVGSGPYSLVEVFTIVATGVGNTNLTIDLTSAAVTPEPGSLAVLGAGLVGLGVVGSLRRRRR